jgi:Ran GTPase-activating protein (RanGAP) involved in mRNA processing and transport
MKIEEIIGIMKKANTTSLDLTKENIEDGDMVKLVEALKTNWTVTAVLLKNVGDKGMAKLAEALETNKKIEVLSIDGIGASGIASLAGALKVNTKLRNVMLVSGGLGIVAGNLVGIGTEGALKLAEALIENKTLKELTISYITATADEATEIAKALQRNTALESLCFSCGGFALGAPTEFAAAIALNTTLKELDLLESSIKTDGVIELAKALKANTTLKKLNFSSNLIHLKGAEALAELLKVNKALEFLGLSYCCMGDDAVIKIAEGLEENATVTKVELNGNLLTRTKAQDALVKALKRNRTLLAVDFICEEKARVEIESCLRRNCALKPIHDEVFALVREMQRLTFLLGFHSRVGGNSPLYFFCGDVIGRSVFEVVSPKLKIERHTLKSDYSVLPKEMEPGEVDEIIKTVEETYNWQSHPQSSVPASFCPKEFLAETSLFHGAVISGNTELVDKLLTSKAITERINEPVDRFYGATILHLAIVAHSLYEDPIAKEKMCRIMSSLIQYGANADQMVNRLGTPGDLGLAYHLEWPTIKAREEKLPSGKNSTGESQEDCHKNSSAKL